MRAPSANTRASRNVRSTASQPLIENPASIWSGCAGVDTVLTIAPTTRLSHADRSVHLFDGRIVEPVEEFITVY